MRRKTRRSGGAATYAPVALFTFASCLGLPAEVCGQWTQPDAAGNVKSTNTGNVGVGGNLLVTSEVEGLGMKSEPVVIGGRQMHAPGTIIGKALEPLEKGTGEILILLSLQ